MKDLSNLVSKRAKTSRNDLNVVVDLLTNKYGEFVLLFFRLVLHYFCILLGALVKVLSDDRDNMFKGLFFQDKYMRQAFQAYPELLCLDATVYNFDEKSYCQRLKR